MNTLAIILATFVGWVGGALGWFRWWHEIRETRIQRAAKEKAEAELREIHRRSAELRPYFVISDERFNSITAPSGNSGQPLGLYPNSGNLLCFWCKEVERQFKAGEPIYLLVANKGSTGLEIEVNLDGESAEFLEAKTNRSVILNMIKYPYRPECHGTKQTIEIRFLASVGVRDIHKYETIHGFRSLRRIDPT